MQEASNQIYFLYLFLQVTERCGLFYNFTAVSGYKGGTVGGRATFRLIKPGLPPYGCGQPFLCLVALCTIFEYPRL